MFQTREIARAREGWSPLFYSPKMYNQAGLKESPIQAFALVTMMRSQWSKCLTNACLMF